MVTGEDSLLFTAEVSGATHLILNRRKIQDPKHLAEISAVPKFYT